LFENKKNCAKFTKREISIVDRSFKSRELDKVIEFFEFGIVSVLQKLRVDLFTKVDSPLTKELSTPYIAAGCDCGHS